MVQWFKGTNYGHLLCYSKVSGITEARVLDGTNMIELEYLSVIEATDEPVYFGFYYPELEGFAGVGHSVKDCLCKAKWGMKELVNLVKERGLPVPPQNPNPKVTI